MKIKIKGFTIIEALIAVSVLTIGFVGVIQIFPGVIGLNARSEDLTVASHLAEMKMEEFIATSYDSISLGTQPTEPTAFTDAGFSGSFAEPGDGGFRLDGCNKLRHTQSR